MPPQDKSERMEQSKLEVIIEDEPLLSRIYSANLADENKGEEEVEKIEEANFEHGREVERRYLPSAEPGILNDDGTLNLRLVNALPGIISKRRIKQAYVYARPAGTKKDEALVRFRLRRAKHYSAEGLLIGDECRIASKSHAEGNKNARIETQFKFEAGDETFSAEKQMFERLWKIAEANQAFGQDEGHVGSFERWYVRHMLPIKDKKGSHWCEIHIERRNGPPAELDGMVRIEVEFDSDADESAARKEPSLLPPWVGIDVTDKREYKSGQLMKKGAPREYKEHIKSIEKEREKRREKQRRTIQKARDRKLKKERKKKRR